MMKEMIKILYILAGQLTATSQTWPRRTRRTTSRRSSTTEQRRRRTSQEIPRGTLMVDMVTVTEVEPVR